MHTGGLAPLVAVEFPQIHRHLPVVYRRRVDDRAARGDLARGRGNISSGLGI
jgi:hypothetical protein